MSKLFRFRMLIAVSGRTTAFCPADFNGDGGVDGLVLAL